MLEQVQRADVRPTLAQNSYIFNNDPVEVRDVKCIGPSPPAHHGLPQIVADVIIRDGLSRRIAGVLCKLLVKDDLDPACCIKGDILH